MKVVAFKIEIDGQKEVTDLTKVFGLLNTQLILVNNTIKEINKSTSTTKTTFSNLEKELKSNVKTFASNNKAAKDLGNGYIEVVQAVDKTSKSIKELKAENKNLKKTLEEAPLEGTKEYKKFQAELEATAKQFTENNNKIKAFSKELRTGVKQSDIAKGSILDLRNNVRDLTKQYNALGEEARKGTDGKKIQKELARTTKNLKRLEEAVGDNRRSVGDYAKGLNGLPRILRRAFIGRNVIDAAAQALRAVVGGLADIVKEGSKTNDTFKGIQNASDSLFTTLQNTGKGFLNAFGSVIQKVIENVSFVIFKVTNAISSLEGSTSTLGKIFSSVFGFLGDVLTNFPAILSGVGAVFGEFGSRVGKQFDNLGIKANKLFVQFKRVATAITGGDTTELNNQLAALDQRLRDNLASTVDYADAYNNAYNATTEEQEAFNKSIQEQTKLDQEREEQLKKNEKAKTERAAAEKQRIAEEKKVAEEARKALEQLEKDRAKLNEQLAIDELARLELTKTFNKELKDIRIQNIKDETIQALEAENLRFEREKINLKERLNQIIIDEEIKKNKIIELFGAESKELKDFTIKSNKDLQDINAISNKILEQQQIEHSNNLNQITEDEISKQQALKDEALQKELDKVEEIEAKKQAAREETKEKVNKTINDIGNVTNSLLDSIGQAFQLASDLEQQRFQESIDKRQETINGLTDEIANATGLQKKFLEQQLKQEQAALEKQNRQAEAAAKKAAETQKAIAIVQAVINTALAVTNALATPPAPLGIALAIAAAAAGAVEIAAISSAKFARGGILDGASHAEGGIPTRFGELEGGEAVINKRSTAMFKNELSEINAKGGGVRFANGGVLGANMRTPNVSSISSVASQENEKFNQMFKQQNELNQMFVNSINNLKVAVPVSEVTKEQDRQSTLQTQTTL